MKDYGIEPGMILDKKIKFVERISNKGSQGVVWKAEQLTARNRLVAVKVLTYPPEYDHAATVAEWDKEASVWVQISHSANVITLHEIIECTVDFAGDKRNCIAFVMQLAKSSLTQLVNDMWPISQPQLLDWMLQICTGLRAGHRLDPPLVHRDIKPDNLLLHAEHEGEEDGNLVIGVSDWGIAGYVGSETSQRWIGTPYFSAPEQWKRGPHETRNDIYSLAVTFLFMIAGGNFREFFEKTEKGYHEILDNNTLLELKDEILASQPENEALLDYCISIIRRTSKKRPQLDSIIRRLNEFKAKLESTHSVSPLTAAESAVRQNLRELSDKLIWNPSLHQEFGERLHFFFLNGSRSLGYIKKHIETLLREELGDQFCLYDLFGAHEILVRAWIREDQLERVVKGAEGVANTIEGDMQHYRVESLRYWSVDGYTEELGPEFREEFFALISRTSMPPDVLCQKLLQSGLAIGKIESVSETEILVFCLITFKGEWGKEGDFDSGCTQIRDLLSSKFESLRDSIDKISTITMGAVSDTEKGDARDLRSRLMIKYNARSFYDVKRIPELLHEAMQSKKLCRLRTDTLLAMELPSRQTDDGAFMDGTWQHEEGNDEMV